MAGPTGNRLTYLDEFRPLPRRAGLPQADDPPVGRRGRGRGGRHAGDRRHDGQRRRSMRPFLRPILDRLKAIDGRAPVSIMTCKRRPRRPRAPALAQGGGEPRRPHADPPLPACSSGGDFAEAKADGPRLHRPAQPDPRQPARRLPDALLRLPQHASARASSPRSSTRSRPAGHFLTIDSSVFNITTPDDPALPRSLVLDPDGRERFRKYLPVPVVRQHDRGLSRIPMSSAASAGSSPAPCRATGRPRTSTSRTTRRRSRT